MAAAAAAAPRVGRPPTGARERLLEAGAEVLKSEGYAGTSLSKVAERAGESKALIAYHFGSKDGLVGAVGRELAEMITGRVLDRIEGATTVEEIARAVVGAVAQIADEDERIPRLYFDLAAVSVVKPDVRSTITEMNRQWRGVLEDLLAQAKDGPPRGQAGPLALLIIAGNQGFALERIERGPTAELERAREMFVRSVVAAA